MDEVPTVYLGQFTDDNAERLGALLDEAGIVWWSKTSARLARVVFAGDWGTRLFVEEERRAEAAELAERLTGSAPR